MDIFVGSLPFKITENTLKELFEKFGEVNSVKLIINKATRLKKGFGFVEMPNEDQALKAIDALNGTELEGRKIIVTRSESKTNEDGSRAFGGNGFKKRSNYQKKPKINEITYGDADKNSPTEKGFKLRRKPQNFKVGKRRKT